MMHKQLEKTFRSILILFSIDYPIKNKRKLNNLNNNMLEVNQKVLMQM